MSLGERLRALLRAEPEWYQEMLAAIATRLNETARRGVLGPGDAMPDFVLPDAGHELVFSDELIADGPLVICFFRGLWCPFCRETLAALQDILPRIEALGGRLVALTPDASGTGGEARDALGLRFAVLSDIDNATGLRFGNVYVVPASYQQALLLDGIDLAARRGAGADLLPMPAIFVVDAAGTIRHAHASGDVTDRAEPETILAVLAELAAERDAPDRPVAPGAVAP